MPPEGGAAMRRREFLRILGAVPVAWPTVAWAQRAMPVIGFLRSEPLTGATNLVSGFRQGLKEAGYIDGQNVVLEFHSAEGHADRLPGLTAELIRRPVNVIVANSIAALQAKTATTTVPIVFATGS